MVCVHIGSVLILPSPCHNPYIVAGTSGNNISKDGSPYYIGIGMVPSIIDVWGYDREFCSSSSSSSPSSSSSSSSSSSTNVTQKLK